MSLLRHSLNKEIKDLTELPSSGVGYSIKTCRLACVGDLNVKGTLFNVVIADTNGLADLTFFDVKMHQTLRSLECKCVTIKGLSCKPKDASGITYGVSRSPNHLLGNDKTVISECEDNTSIPGASDVDDIPDGWKMDEAVKAELLLKIGSSPNPRSLSNMTQGSSQGPKQGLPGGPCCSVPHGEICKKTGEKHALNHVLCAVCRTEIMPGEPFCADISRKGMGCVLQASKRTREDMVESSGMAQGT